MRRFLSGAVAAVSLASGAVAADLVTSINLEGIKAIFDAHSIPAKIEGNAGFEAVTATVNDQLMIAYPIDCANKDRHGSCGNLIIQSNAYMTKAMPTADQFLDYQRDNVFFSHVMRLPSGHVMIRQIVNVSDGVGADYVKGKMKNFLGEDAMLQAYLIDTLKASSGGATGGFAASGDGPGLASQPSPVTDDTAASAAGTAAFGN